MAFFPANSTYPGMLGELYSGAFTAAAFNWICSPAITELEIIVLDWLAILFNLPSCFQSASEGGGVIQGTTSEAVVTMMVVARERYLKESTADLAGDDRENAINKKRGKLVALASDMAHTCTQKAAVIAGTRYKSASTKIEDDFAMTGEALRRTLEECRDQGLEPYYLTVTLGSTATCAVDRFGEIAEVLKDYPHIWTHVDAAYAGAALVCEEYHHLTQHFEAFDSFSMNMHKWLLVNFDATCLWVKQRKYLIDTLSITPSYMRNPHTESGLVTDYRDWQIPLGRRFRSLKIWFVLRTYGVQGLKEYIRGHIKLSEIFHSLIRERSDLFKVLTTPAFALTVFNVVPRPQALSPATSTGNHSTPDAGAKALVDANSITKEVYELIVSRGKIYITSTVLDNTYAIRLVSANPKAEEKYLRAAFDILVKTAEEVLEKHAQTEVAA